jgi:hypothetical protein
VLLKRLWQALLGSISPIQNISLKSKGKTTFMDLIASCACSIVTISINSVICGSKSWFTISILESPDVRMDVNPAIAAMKRLEAIGVFRVGVSAAIQLPFRDAIRVLDLGVRNVRKSKRLPRRFAG